ncbi:MAG: hypothetical protein R2849_14755 [Thermomicrobiales bacterium]
MSRGERLRNRRGTNRRRGELLSAQILWILLIAVIVILILAAFGSGVVDLGGDNGIVDPTAAP